MVCGVFVARLLMQANKIAVKVCRTFVRLPLILSFSVDTFFFLIWTILIGRLHFFSVNLYGHSGR